MRILHVYQFLALYTVADIFRQPRHAYTLGLLNSVPSGGATRKPLLPIAGAPPDLATLPAGCPFAPRCTYVTEACRSERPPLLPVGPARFSACIHNDLLARPGEDVPA